MVLQNDEEEEEKEKGVEKEEEKVVEEEIIPAEEIKRKRRTKKLEKGIIVLEPEEWINIDNIQTIRRLPEKKQKVIYKVSSYYMNNREIFINSINSLFEPYRDQILDDSQQLTCDDLGDTSKEFTLLTHQKIVRDYLNLYTPYRGLLLYHGLGSGKTCTSIAVAEGMKSAKQIIVMTPASLRRNYIEELKKCGDSLYKKTQFWQWVSIEQYPQALKTLSSILNLPVEYIQKKKGVWFVNVTKQSNYNELDSNEKKSLDEQLDEMIQTKYKFINYNGLRRNKLKLMTNNFENNIFDNAVIIIDEAHNFISRIVNKLKLEKEIPTDRTGKKERVNYSTSLILYEFLLSAQNARVILLTGTPIINYPNEIGILFNILRGYIKTWEMSLDIKTSQAFNKEKIIDIFEREKIHDYIDYSPSTKKITITRNPFGFESKLKKDSGYHGVTNKAEEKKDPVTGEMIIYERGQISDAEFEKKMVMILRKYNIEVIPGTTTINMFKALPDKFDDFMNRFIDIFTGEIKDVELLKKRIMGLTSYFRSAQEKLLPKYEKISDFHVVKIPMSNYQFTIYEQARKDERITEKASRKGDGKMGKVDANGIYKEPTSTYRIFSRLFCNYVMPKPPGRPMPLEFLVNDANQEEKKENNINALIKKAKKRGKQQEVIINENENEDEEEEQDDDEDENRIIELMGDDTYAERIKTAIRYVKEHSSELLNKTALETYSPKYLNILENIQDPDHIGLHLVYSQFRSLEGIEMFTLVLEYNGFTRFKIKKNSTGEWELDISEENRGKPTFALYTGTESAEEKEVIRNIFNGDWPESTLLTRQLKEIANNNNVGEIIKVLMITSSGSEGINLRNTRYVHIMEPYWHPARIEQVVGRARRICSHKNLPESLQTVEVFLYLMTFSKEQIDSDDSIELKKKDLSKKMYVINNKKNYIPFTSDEALFEISTIKEEVNEKLITAIKESSIDCAIYSRVGTKEQLHCLQFPNPKPTTFSYNPSINKDQPDTMAAINKTKVEWTGVEVIIKGKTYIARNISNNIMNIYDLDSFKRAQEVAGIEPVLIGTLERNERGQQVFKKI